MSVDLSETIGNTKFTIQWLLNRLDEKCVKYQTLSKDSKLQKFDVKVISEGMGYLSAVYCCILEFEGQTNSSISVCLKVPSLAKVESMIQDKSALDEMSGVHDRECTFYEKFAPNSGILIPQIYSLQCLGQTTESSTEPHILMEYLDGGANISLGETFTVELLHSCAAQLAKLHAFSLKNPELWSKGFEPIDFGKNQNENNNAFDEMSDKIDQTLEKYGGPELLEAVKRLDPVAKDADFINYPFNRSHLDAGKGNNVIVKTVDAKFTNEVRGFIDWQITCASNPSIDIIRLLIINTDTQIRRDHEQSILRFYYDCFCRELSPQPPPFSFDQLFRASRAPFVAQVLFGCFLGAFHFQREDQEEERKIYLHRLKEAAIDAYKIMEEHKHEWTTWNLQT
ncbi:putative oxidoreductase dhs-27 [Aphelenchoides besseyi]|nr:putative oxidoreductase dhs-27 [Aphelenchoides besseyi]